MFPGAIIKTQMYLSMFIVLHCVAMEAFNMIAMDTICSVKEVIDNCKMNEFCKEEIVTMELPFMLW